jgi:hypothetical protein
MQDLVKLEWTSGCEDDRGIVDATTRWLICVSAMWCSTQCSCVGQQFSLGFWGILLNKKILNFTMYIKYMVLIYISDAKPRANIICHAIICTHMPIFRSLQHVLGSQCSWPSYKCVESHVERERLYEHNDFHRFLTNISQLS